MGDGPSIGFSHYRRAPLHYRRIACHSRTVVVLSHVEFFFFVGWWMVPSISMNRIVSASHHRQPESGCYTWRLLLLLLFFRLVAAGCHYCTAACVAAWSLHQLLFTFRLVCLRRAQAALVRVRTYAWRHGSCPPAVTTGGFSTHCILHVRLTRESEKKKTHCVP